MMLNMDMTSSTSPTRGQGTKLILWDIDGTIVIVKRGVYDPLFAEMCRKVYGKDVEMGNYRYSGKTDRGIIHELGEMAGFSEVDIEERLPEATEFIARGLEERLEEKDITLLPNVLELLEIFDKHEGVVQGLLTGNLPECAELKLRPFGVQKYFKFGVYGIESRDRNDLGPIALERAIEHMPHPPMHPKDVVIIGDSIRDIECANAIGATCILTLTGHTKMEEIAHLDPDHIVEDLSDTEQIMRMVLGEAA
jgi:phosphoglycolate phosphatase